MRKISTGFILFFIIFLFANLAAAQNITINRDSMDAKTTVNYKGIKIGEKADNVKFDNVLNSPQNTFSLKDLKDKIVIVEFWATWCGPCLPAMEHLKSLKEKFSNQLEVISVLHESEERLQRFIKNKPSSIWHTADPEMKTNQYFPHRAVPHTVIIDRDGKVAAITRPDEITEDVINKLINKQSVNLTKKDDGLNEGFDMSKDYFPKPESTEYSFDFQPPIPGGFPMTQRQRKGVWAGRRMTMINQPILNIYKTVFGFNSVRLIYEGVDKAEFESQKAKTNYCLDIIVPKGKENELLNYGKAELEKLNFEVKARVEKRKTEVGVLTVVDKEKLLSHQSKKDSAEQSVFGMINASQYKRKGVSLDEMLKGFLESFGHGRLPLVNETGVDGLFDFDISLDLEDKLTIKNTLAEYGLRLTKEEREVELLVIYKDK
ncbi:MAG TPA: redoxin domain-containing protein [Pyrinomonadaceae bacterium]|nr:redoxin domain-containing protein [Pyrinomonadaceae bacterium]